MAGDLVRVVDGPNKPGAGHGGGGRALTEALEDKQGEIVVRTLDFYLCS